MKLMLAHLLLEATGAADGSLAWEGDGAALQRPPAFRELRVLAVRDLTPHMRRVRFACDDMARYAQDTNIHVKLLFPQDRKSTRLNSSHLVISYAVFCLQK